MSIPNAAIVNKRVKKPLPITGLWVRRIGINVEVLIENGGKWTLVFQEEHSGMFSEILEPLEMLRKIVERSANDTANKKNETDNAGVAEIAYS